MEIIMLPALTGLFILFDLVSGGLAACVQHEWKSSEMRIGLYHKVGSLMLVALGYLLDYAQKYADIGVDVPVASAICVYIIVMELGSVVENLGKINPELLPENVRNIIGMKK